MLVKTVTAMTTAAATPSRDTPPIATRRCTELRLRRNPSNRPLAGTTRMNAIPKPVANHNHQGQVSMAALSKVLP